jgi:DNA polymerase I
MTDGESTLLLIDGHSLAFRAFYALSPESFKAPDGQHTNAVHGFISMMLNLLEKEKPTHLCVAFDVSGPTFRTEEYPEYKGTRSETPEEFLGQTELIQQALEAMNIRWVTKPGFEADDLLATLARQGDEAMMRVLVVSGDRDTFQLISDRTTVLYPVKGVLNLARMDDAAVLERYGVHANQYRHLAALVGEASDNLPGIPGVGPKTAAKWIQQFGSVEAVLEHADELPGKVGESLREHRENAIRNLKLNRLLTDLEVNGGVHDFGLGEVDEARVRAIFDRLNFRSLLTRVLKLRGVNGTQLAPSQTTASVAPAPNIDRVLFEPPATLNLSGAELAAFTRARNPFLVIEIIDGSVVGLGVADGDERANWSGGESAEVEALIATGGFGLWDAKATRHRLAAIGLKLGPVTNDALLAAYLLDPTARDYSPDSVLEKHTGVTVERADANQLLAETDPSLDAWVIARGFAESERALIEQGQQVIYRDIELPSMRVLGDMESTGIAVDREVLQQHFDELTAEVDEIAQAAYAIIGHEVNLASPKQLQDVLFVELGMQGTRSVKTGYSTNAEALLALYEQTGHPFLEKLLEHREVSKIRQITETLLKATGPDGRIHTTYLQTATATGRLSSENPNLQNIPIKTDRGARIRSAFIAGDGFETLLTADYSQIEMRIMAHLSADQGLIDAFNAGLDLHNAVGARIYGVSPEAVDSGMRSKVKAMSYGLVYGLSEFGLARQLKISRAEAKQLMTDYFERFGGVKNYLARVVDLAKSLGYTATVLGRRRPFEDLNSKIFQIRENARRAALNAPIQGTAADVMKLAMIRIADEMGARGLRSQMLLQVHDELVFEVAAGELAELTELVVGTMSQIIELSVPLDVHVGVGQNWDTAGH